MTVDQLIELEVRVHEMAEELAAEIEEAEKRIAPPGKLDGTEGRLSRQDSMINHEIAKEGQRRRQMRLKLLYDAIKRMDAGTYGVCEYCGEEIEDSRLESHPEAPLCGKCA